LSFPERLEPTSAHHLTDGTCPAGDVEQLRLSLSATLDAAVLARQGAGELLLDRVSEAEMIDTLLMVSELVTNAVRYPIVAAPATVQVHIALADARLRVEVYDGGRGFDVPAQPPTGIGGLGLVIVDRAASRWGVSNGGPPNCVWFELDRASGGNVA
jgi:anti-sigma regulatory factor (Ser/Thr protein kinase)